MLKKITINNYTTFMKPTEIDFEATNYKFLGEENIGSNHILKGALFVGENASGKTQIIKAIELLLDLLFSDNDINLALLKSFYSKTTNWNMTYEFVIENATIIYDIEFDMGKVFKEKLAVNKDTILERLGNKVEFNLNNKLSFDVSDNLLALRRIYFDTRFYEDKILNSWFDFLKNSIYINCYNRHISSYNKKMLANEFLSEKGVKPINDFFDKIDYRQHIQFDNYTNNPKGYFNVMQNDKFVSFKKDGTNIYIPNGLESTGNKTLIQLLPSFMYVIQNNAMLLIDEFSSGFHNELEECLIKYFNHYANDSQLIFTSHSTNLLNNTILRPDQIYSVMFDAKKGSVLTRFSDENPREAQNTEKMYLGGAIGEVPRYNKIFKD